MNPKWLTLATEMLKEYSSLLGNNGCNDWDWPKGWTKSERLDFARRMVAANVRKNVVELTEEEEQHAKHMAKAGTSDFWVASFLSGEIKNLGGGGR